MDFFNDKNHRYEAPRDEQIRKVLRTHSTRHYRRMKNQYRTLYLQQIVHKWFGITFVLHHRVNYRREMESTFVTIARVIDRWIGNHCSG